MSGLSLNTLKKGSCSKPCPPVTTSTLSFALLSPANEAKSANVASNRMQMALSLFISSVLPLTVGFVLRRRRGEQEGHQVFLLLRVERLPQSFRHEGYRGGFQPGNFLLGDRQVLARDLT